MTCGTSGGTLDEHPDDRRLNFYKATRKARRENPGDDSDGDMRLPRYLRAPFSPFASHNCHKLKEKYLALGSRQRLHPMYAAPLWVESYCIDLQILMADATTDLTPKFCKDRVHSFITALRKGVKETLPGSCPPHGDRSSYCGVDTAQQNIKLTPGSILYKVKDEAIFTQLDRIGIDHGAFDAGQRQHVRLRLASGPNPLHPDAQSDQELAEATQGARRVVERPWSSAQTRPNPHQKQRRSSTGTRI